MDYSVEPWIKVYTRDTGGWSSLTWQARGLSLEISRKLDARGEIPLGTRGLPALAGLLRASWAEIEPFVRELIADGRLVVDGPMLRDPGHVERQLARTSDAMRKKMQRDREAASHDVTARHSTSHDVTNRSDQKRSEEITTPPASLVSPSEGDRTEPKRRRGPVRKPNTACPSTGTSETDVAAWAGTWNLPVEHPEFGKFLEHHRTYGNLFADWSAAWRTWLRKAPEFARRRQVDTRQPLLDVASAKWLRAGGGDL
jgi:hypothetical protein